jgi:Regulator of ribonuclease activity B
MGFPTGLRTIALQQVMNRTSWAALQEHGVDETTEVELEFFYAAPGEGEASRLVEYLRGEADYDARAVSQKGAFSKRTWVVTGKTRPTTISLEVLDQWVQWMVAAGAANGGCEFDGWRAQVP